MDRLAFTLHGQPLAESANEKSESEIASQLRRQEGDLLRRAIPLLAIWMVFYAMLIIGTLTGIGLRAQ